MGAFVGLALTASARAGPDPSTFFGGVSPRDLVQKKVDTSNVIAPVSTPSKISLGGILSKFHIPGLKTGGPQAPMMPIRGPVPASAKGPYQPLMPILPSR